MMGAENKKISENTLKAAESDANIQLIKSKCLELIEAIEQNGCLKVNKWAIKFERLSEEIKYLSKL